MAQTISEILDDLKNFVAGRGRDDNFCYSKVYSPSSSVRCVDFSPWIKKRLIMNDTFALAVYKAQCSLGKTFGYTISARFSLSDNKEVDIYDVDVDADIDVDIDVTEFYENRKLDNSFSDENIARHEKEILKILRIPFEEHFNGEIEAAKLDLETSWLLSYPNSQLVKILMAYNLFLKNADLYMKRYNEIKMTQNRLPTGLPTTTKFSEFQNEYRKLPLASRLHLLDVYEYSGFSKTPKLRLLSDMTLYETRKIGIDEFESADVLCQSKLITSYPDGTGHINPEYTDTTSAVIDYANQITPAYSEWHLELSDTLIGFQRDRKRNG